MGAPELVDVYNQFGCNLSDLNALAANQPPGSLGDTPLGQQQQPRSAQMVSGDRFRFDAASIGGLNQASEFGQRSIGATYHPEMGCQGQVCGSGRGSTQSHRASFHHQHSLPHTSCTSIPQNLSTSDQQPLIVDAQSDKCLHQHQRAAFAACQHQHQHQHHLSSGQLDQSQNGLSQCGCLGGAQSSFMGARKSFAQAREPDPCTCCERGLNSPNYADYAGQERAAFQSASGGLPAKGAGLGTIYRPAGAQELPGKARTLTRVYKALNDVELTASTTNLPGPIPANFLKQTYNERL